MSKHTHRSLGGALLAASLLAACGGDGDDDTTMPPPAGVAQVPDSALVSSASYTQFAIQAAGAGSETAEPLNADNLTTPPSSETDEPAVIS
jgi:hypothetical protein